MGVGSASISWMSRKQKTVVLSTDEARSMFHQVSGTGRRGCWETHKGDVWENPEILGKFRGDGETSRYV